MKLGCTNNIMVVSFIGIGTIADFQADENFPEEMDWFISLVMPGEMLVYKSIAA